MVDSDKRVRVLVRRLETFPSDWPLPAYATPGSAALDLRNAGPAIALASLERVLVPTGLAIALPEGFEAQVRPRSGLAIKHGLTLVNTPGTIDSDYRGEILVPMINLDRGEQRIEHGDRIAQLLLAQVVMIEWEATSELPDSRRGTGGFGSTGR
ncbi:MAG: dUTP diphosphatase [Longimicrobiales bacterium]